MVRTAARRWTDTISDETLSVDAEIRAFLNGDTNGEPLLHALYDQVLDEPIPARLLASLRR